MYEFKKQFKTQVSGLKEMVIPKRSVRGSVCYVTATTFMISWVLDDSKIFSSFWGN